VLVLRAREKKDRPGAVDAELSLAVLYGCVSLHADLAICAEREDPWLLAFWEGRALSRRS
jgi:hypothetical protein